ncbi:MAG: radical SAM family heme chaperone HemW [Rickettsiales bacterium]|nr:radical SAM family heme chaperone HemW [Rickettsiales bacterium]
MKTPLALYIHWPFCKAKCPYCDFNSHVRASVDVDAWQSALQHELEDAATKIASDMQLVSIFFGGGTPSLMPPSIAASLIALSTSLFDTTPAVEITLEANPTSAEASAFEAFHRAGVSRLSLGIQSLRAQDLMFLGRQHNVQEARTALLLAKQVFPRFSFDLIYARPNMTRQSWQEELEEALEMAGDHLSLYQLTIEPETPFERFYRAGDFVLPDEDTAAALYEDTLSRCLQAGLHRYEVSNFARKGSESRHNLAYWRGEQYIGIGPGAHGRYRDRHSNQWIASETLRSPERWLQQVSEQGHGTQNARTLTMTERAEEILMTSLRLHEGVSKEALMQATGLPLDMLASASKRAALVAQGLLHEDVSHVRASEKGMHLLDYVLSELLA